MFEVLIWVGLVVMVGLGVLALDRIIRRLINQFSRAQYTYPHRVANQLPRTLHKGDCDEIVELTNDPTISSK